MKGSKEVEQSEVVDNSDEKTETKTENKAIWYKPAFSENQCKFLAEKGVIALSLGTEKREPTYTGSLKAYADKLISEKFPDYPMESREVRSGEKKKEKAINDVMKIAPNMSKEELIALAQKLNELVQ